MFNIDHSNEISQLIKKYGNDAQTDQAIEELAELIQAISKKKRVERGEYTDPIKIEKIENNLVEEIADVEILLETLILMYGIDPNQIEKIKQEKFKRAL